MNDHSSEPPNIDHSSSQILPSHCPCRWEIYRRLKLLDINCQCHTNEPLQADLYGPTTLVQIWSVLLQAEGQRDKLIGWLNTCWQQKYINYEERSAEI